MIDNVVRGRSNAWFLVALDGYLHPVLRRRAKLHGIDLDLHVLAGEKPDLPSASVAAIRMSSRIYRSSGLTPAAFAAWLHTGTLCP